MKTEDSNHTVDINAICSCIHVNEHVNAGLLLFDMYVRLRVKEIPNL